MEKTKSKESERLNASLIISLRILEFLEETEQPASLAEIRNKLALNKSRVMRLCGTLEHMGYLKHDQEAGVYCLGPKLFSLGKAYERQTPIIEAIRPVLKTMVANLQETASFHVLRGQRRLCLCAEESPHQVRYTMKEGSEGPYPYGSIWKVIMAWGPEELKEKILSEVPFEPETPFSIVSGKALSDIVQITKEKGYCHTNGDHDVGSSAVAAPVLDQDGHLLGVLCLSGITERMNGTFLEKAVPILKEKAAQLSILLKGRSI